MDQIIVEIIKNDEELKDILKNKVREAMRSEEFQDVVKDRIINIAENVDVDNLYEVFEVAVTEHFSNVIKDNVGSLFTKKSKKKKENKQ